MDEKREEVLKQVNSNSLDYRFLYEYYINKGGHLPFKIFSQTFPLFSMGRTIEDILQKLIVEYEITLLYDRNNNLIRAL